MRQKLIENLNNTACSKQNSSFKIFLQGKLKAQISSVMNFTKHFMKEYHHHHHHRLLQKIEVKEAFPTQIWKNLQIFQRKQNCTPTSLMNPDAKFVQFSSVQFSHSVMSDSLRPDEPQHARPPCPSPTPGVHPNPCLLCPCCHQTISSSVFHFFSCPQSFPASRSFQMSLFK